MPGSQGQPEHAINYFFFVAEEVREIMAALGFRTFDEMIGQSQCLDKERAVGHWKSRGLDFEKLFHKIEAPEGVAVYNSERQNHGLDKVLDRKLIDLAKPALEEGSRVKHGFRSATATAPRAPCCRARSPSATATTACRRTPCGSPSRALRGRASGRGSPTA